MAVVTSHRCKSHRRLNFFGPDVLNRDNRFPHLVDNSLSLPFRRLSLNNVRISRRWNRLKLSAMETLQVWLSTISY